ncbi:glycosyltransferase family 9 protein [Granulicella cerasi]|uniref:Glycosyltransferase family 9 protein n=1 Tax=Granulicella cerasi TaxID=741063 RepID=A0ABW1ZDD0_9BACT|nr:glycosyltransferase family 9 protein [Granulicella cerasi]
MPDSKTKRVLLYRLGSLGDHLIAIPCYRQARRAFPNAEMRLLTNIPVAAKAAAAEAVLGNSGLVDGFETYVVGERSPLALLKLMWRIRRYGADTMVYLAGPRGMKAAERDRAFFRLCGIKRIIGLPLTEDEQKNRLLRTEADGKPLYEAEADRLARCVAAELGDPVTSDPANFAPGLTAAERAEADALLAPLAGRSFFAFSIGTKSQANHWGLDRWTSFFRQWASEHPESGLVVLGAPNEAAESEEVAAAWREGAGGKALNLCGASSPRVSAAVMERARMFFGHDSGPGHLAASVATPVMSIFSSRNVPGQWYPFGRHVRVLQHWVSCGACGLEVCTVEGKRCILSISVDEALAAARTHLMDTAILERRP